MNLKTAVSRTVIAAFAAAAPALVADSAVPTLINYQAYVTDDAGEPLGEGTPTNRKVWVKFYTQVTGGSAVYAEEQICLFYNGMMNTLIGQGVEIAGLPKPALDTVFTGAEIYVGLSVSTNDADDPETEITPRQRIVATPVAFRAKVAETVLDDSVDGAAIAAGVVTSSHIADGTISAADVAADAVEGNAIKAGVVESVHIKDGTITSADVAQNTLTNHDIAENVIQEWHLAHQPMITSERVVNGAITGEDIAADTLTAADIAPNAIESGEIKDGEVKTPDLADGAVTGAKIADNLFHVRSYGYFTDSVDTGYSSTDWSACIVGIDTTSGDVNEEDRNFHIDCYAVPDFLTGKWRVYADWGSHMDRHESWTVHVLFIPADLVKDERRDEF